MVSTGAINTQGASKGIKITLAKGAKITVTFAASGSNTGRFIKIDGITNTSFTVTGTQDITGTANEAVTETFTVTEAGQYLIGSTNGVRIGKVVVDYTA